MNISALSSLDLTSRLKKLVQTERRITHLVLECIAEIDRRQLYLERAYSSLYEFLVHEYGYSPSSALRRIESARLLREIPEVAQKIESGALNLSHLSKVQQAIRTVQKTNDRQVPVAEKRELLKKVENATQVQTDAILARELSIPIPKYERTRINSDDSVTLTITFTREQVSVLREVQDLISHSVPEKSWAPLFFYLAQKELKRRSPSAKSRTDRPESRGVFDQNAEVALMHSEAHTETQKETQKEIETEARTEAKTKISETPYFKKSKREENDLRKIKSSVDLWPQGRKTKKTVCSRNPTAKAHDRQDFAKSVPRRGAISRPVRRELFVRSAGCEYRSPLTQKVCGSRRFLQVDHIKPVWAMGSDHQSNLRLLCAKHNQQRYRQQSNLTSVAEVTEVR